MITEQDLQEAIAECQGERNPNANTCIKLASFYTIRNEMYGPQKVRQYSGYSNDTEFMRVIDRVGIDRAMPVLDELMETLQILNPRLYASAIRKLKDV